MNSLRDSALIYGDLCHSYNELQQQKHSPVTVRRSFGNFIFLSQQLTTIMYKEFKAITGKTWEASKSGEWNAITDLFKKLRRTDFHEFPIIIHVRETQYIAAREVFHDDKISQLIAVQGTWELGDPFTENIPTGIETVMIDTRTGAFRF